MHIAPALPVPFGKTMYKLASSQSGTGNLITPPTTLMAKEICEAINVKAGVTDADVSEFFEEEATELDTPAEDDKNLLDHELEEEAISPEVPSVITTERYSSIASSAIISTGNAASIANSKAKMKINLLSSAITASSDATMNALENFFSNVEWQKSLSGSSAGWSMRRTFKT
jgi:hypothetical protein